MPEGRQDAEHLRRRRRDLGGRLLLRLLALFVATADMVPRSERDDQVEGVAVWACLLGQNRRSVGTPISRVAYRGIHGRHHESVAASSVKDRLRVARASVQPGTAELGWGGAASSPPLPFPGMVFNHEDQACVVGRSSLLARGPSR
jgi:hypothetical protein